MAHASKTPHPPKRQTNKQKQKKAASWYPFCKKKDSKTQTRTCYSWTCISMFILGTLNYSYIHFNILRSRDLLKPSQGPLPFTMLDWGLQETQWFITLWEPLVIVPLSSCDYLLSYYEETSCLPICSCILILIHLLSTHPLTPHSPISRIQVKQHEEEHLCTGAKWMLEP